MIKQTIQYVVLTLILLASPALLASGDCLQFRVVGICIWIIPYPFDIEVTIKYGHFNPDVNIVVEREGKILDQDVPTYAVEDPKRVADETHNRNHDNLMYKEALATGNPLAGRIMCPSHAETTIYFKSEADFPSWKWVGLDMFTLAAWVPGVRDIGESLFGSVANLVSSDSSTSSSGSWDIGSISTDLSSIVESAGSSESGMDSASGYISSLSESVESVSSGLSDALSGGWSGDGIYPRTGWTTQHSDSKGAGVVAHRVGDIITNEDEPHIYNDDLAEGESIFVEDDYFTWAPDPLKENTNEEGWFQPILPTADENCYVFGEEDSDQYIDEDGEYTWILWRPYQCCEIGDGFLIDINFMAFPSDA